MSDQKIEVVVSGKVSLTQVSQEVNATFDNLGKKAQETSGKVSSATQQMEMSWSKMVTAFTSGNLISKAIDIVLEKLAEMKQYVADSAHYAARVETLGIAMRIVGNNAGYTGAQMEAYEEQVKKMGITTEAARQTLTQMSGAQMDLAKAGQLARVAQDAAVIGGLNSSETMMRMIQGIRSGETEILRTIGINVQFENSYKKLADSIGVAKESLTEHQKSIARQNAVLEYGINIQGTYEASMTTTGKKVTSLSRYYDELKLSFGEAFSPALGELIDLTTEKLQGLLKHFKENQAAYKEFAQNIASIVRAVAHPIDTIQKGFWSQFDFKGNNVTERIAIDEEIASNTARVNKVYEEAKERQRIRQGEAAREAQAAEAARSAREKELEKEQQLMDNRDNAVTKYWNGIQDHLRSTAPWLDKHQLAVEKINIAYENQLALLVKTDPLYTKQKNTLDRTKEQALERLKYEEEAANKYSWLIAIGANADMGPFTREQLNAKGIMSSDQQEALDRRIWADRNAAGHKADELEQLGKELDEEYNRQELLSKTNPWIGLRDGVENYSASIRSLGESFADFSTNAMKSFEDALVKTFRTGKLSFTDMINSMLTDITRLMVQQTITKPLAGQLAGLMPSLFGGGGYTGGLDSAVANSSYDGAFDVPLPGRAAGGPVSYGQTYLVGERGPELFTPSSSGTITPNKSLGGLTINVPVTVDGSNRLAGQLRTEIEATVERVIRRHS